jgi:hypothetical protein
MIPRFDIEIPDAPQVLASVEDNTPRPVFGVPVCVIEGGEAAVEIETVGDVFAGGSIAAVEIVGVIVGAAAEAMLGADGDNTRGGLKGGQILM